MEQAAHQGARRLAVEGAGKNFKHDGREYPAVSATASLGADGAVTVTACNTDSEKSVDLSLSLAGRELGKPTAQLIAAKKLTTCNTFDKPQAVTAKRLTVTVKGKSVSATLPPGSVASFRFSSAGVPPASEAGGTPALRQS